MAKIVHYINLEASVDRRAAIEKSFREVVWHGGWELKRFSATGAGEVGDLAGILSASEKACFVSHRNAIQSTLDNDDSDMIVEDDCAFSRNVFRVVTDGIDSLDESKWDILFLEVGISSAAQMLELKFKRDRLLADDKFCMLDLSEYTFHGALSYIVNKNSKAKIIQNLNRFSRLDVPYDLVLRHLCHTGELRGFVIFPFVTEHSAHARMSSIQDASTHATDEILNTFRSLMYIDRDLDDLTLQTSHFEKNYSDQESLIFGRLVSALLSSKFKAK